MHIKAYPQGSSIIVDFGEMVVKFPTVYKVPVTNVQVGGRGVIHFRVNGGENDFLILETVILGHEPYYIPSDYTILEDKTGLGKAWLRSLAPKLHKLKGKDYRSPRHPKDGYREIMMVGGDVICAKVYENGEIGIKIYNENGKPYVAFYKLDQNQNPHLISSTYPEELVNKITDLLVRNVEFLMRWAKNKKLYKRYLRRLRREKYGRRNKSGSLYRRANRIDQ